MAGKKLAATFGLVYSPVWKALIWKENVKNCIDSQELVDYFFKNLNFGQKLCFSRKTIILDTFYGNFENISTTALVLGSRQQL